MVERKAREEKYIRKTTCGKFTREREHTKNIEWETTTGEEYKRETKRWDKDKREKKRERKKKRGEERKLDVKKTGKKMNERKIIG